MRHGLTCWRRWPGAVIVVIIAVLAFGLAASAYLLLTGVDTVAPPRMGAVLTGRCLKSTRPLTAEQSRLTWTLPSNRAPSRRQRRSFAQQMISGGGFADFGPRLRDQLCGLRSLTAARADVSRDGSRLWKLAVARAQGHGAPSGSLPRSDDRPLYWTRLQAEAALTQWSPRFVVSDAQRAALITRFDKAARGMTEITFPAGKNVKRIVLSGFDPYQLVGGGQGPAPVTVGNDIRHGNPSGALTLALDGTRYRTPGGRSVVIEAYILPVDFAPLRQGYLEDTVGPFMRPGPQEVDASITISQAGPFEFDLEQWNSRYHGTFVDNANSDPCPFGSGAPQLPTANHNCDITAPPSWGGSSRFRLFDPPQWTHTTLPVAAMIGADTGIDVARPPGDRWPDHSVAFGVVWHTSYTELPHCDSTKLITRQRSVPVTYPPRRPATPPDPGSCAWMGGGGNYLSNESAYRNTLLAEHLQFKGDAGHIHTPDMQQFAQGDRFQVTDSTFDAWRTAIISQGTQLIHTVGDSAPDLR